jgi:hypothetical protein
MAGVVGTVRAQDITLSGTVTSAAGTSTAGTTVRVSNPADRTEYAEAGINGNGEFSVNVPEKLENYGVEYFTKFGGRYIQERNALPLLYDFGTAEASEDGTLGEFGLPEAHVIQIQCLDTDGNPIEGLPVNFLTTVGSGLRPGVFTTTANGYLKYIGATETGVELSGPTRVVVQPPSRSGNPDYLRLISVTEPQEIQLTVSNPTRYYGVSENDGNTDATASSSATDSSSAGVGSGRSRGFLSNRAAGEEPTGPLSNAVNLTTLGFLLSIAGIGYQLIEGR